MSKDGELDLKGLLTKFPNPIDDLKVIRESCKLTDQIPLAEPVVGGPEGALANGNADITTPKLTVRKRGRDDKDPVRVVRTRVTTKGRSIVVADAGPSAPASSPTESGSSGELVVFDPIFHDFGQKMGPVLAEVMSKRLQASFGPLLLEAKAGESLKQQLAQINTKLAESEGSRSKLNAQVEALKAELLQCKQKVASEAAVAAGQALQRELHQVKHDAANSKTSIANLERELNAARKDIAIRTEKEENLKAQLKSYAGQMEALKAESSSNLDNIQQQLQTEKMAANKFKDLLHKEVSKVSDLDEQLVVLKGEIDNQKFLAERAEKAQSTPRAELSKFKTELRMLQIAGK
ncbi:hypothetical protein R1sor_026236 [Riccia sorocarpa]|uniref:Uncharacterized protein n=1 Tax=Riccia sorocarpa TaxID=122646 RepID=A0ABD3GAT6_9MARC